MAIESVDVEQVVRWSAEWLPPAEIAVRGTVVLLPGRGEPASAYVRLGLRLAVDGYRVVAAGPEQRSGPALAAALRSDPGPQPVVLIGADTGATIALARSATALEDGVAGVVLAGLPVDDGPSRLRADRSWAAELDARTACPTHRQRLDENPELVRGALWVAPVGVGAGTGVSDPQVPVLALHGELDVISPLPALRTVLEPVAGVRLVVVAGGRHDVMNDLQHRSVAAEIVQFLERLRQPDPARPILLRSLDSAADQSTVER